MNAAPDAPEMMVDHRLATWFRTGSALAAALVAALGVVVLVGWWLDLAAIKSVLPGWVTMKVNTALGFLLAGLALGLSRTGSPRWARLAGQACAGAVALLGLLTLAEILGGWDFGIDNILFPEPATAAQTSYPGRMAPATAFNFLFSGLALTLLDVTPRRGLRPAQFLILPPLAVAFIVVTGYLYGAEVLYRIPPFTSIALHTALGFAFLGAGILGARPEHGWMALLVSNTVGGVLVRRLLPVVLVVIPALFWLRLLGERQGHYGTEFGIVLMVLTNILILCGVFWWSAGSLNRKEAERQRIEAQLRKLSLAIEQSPESVVITNLDAEIEYVNEAFARNTGYPREQAIGRNPRFLQSGKTPPETWAALWDALTHGRTWKGELINQRQDGSEYVDFAILSPLRQPDGTISHYVGVQEDITEIRRLGEELARHHDHLEELVAERTAQLQEARRAAEAAAEVKSAFLANMSHEIRTPLNAVLGFARIGARDSVGRASQETYGRILDAGEHLLGVINDILDYSKIEAGKFGIESRPFRLDAVLANASSFVLGIAQQKGLACTVEKAGDLPEWVRGDARRLQQILVNFLSNAVKFTERGEVRVRVAREGSTTYFKVIDTGIGMSAEEVARLFRPFEQADGSTTRKYGGTGLGLAISKSLAQLMGGEITVESAPGQGSAFTLQLPLLASEPPADAGEAGAAAAFAGRRLEGYRVLAAEDVAVNRFILADLLAEAGAYCVFAENGQEAVERVASDAAAFDVVLMDVQMPVMDGHEAARRIRGIAPGMPVIGLTAHALDEEREKCRAAGMVDHVTKPIDPELLIAAILRWARHGAADAAPAARAAPALAPALPAPEARVGMIDWPSLDARFKGKMAFVRKLAEAALGDLAEAPANLRRLAEAGDFAGLAFVAHSLKGLAGNFAAADVQSLAVNTEKAAKNQDAQASALASQLADLTTTLIDELRVFTREDS